MIFPAVFTFADLSPGWRLEPPYKPNELYRTRFLSEISTVGDPLEMGDAYEFKCTRVSSGRIFGTVLSRDFMVDGENWGDGNVYNVVLDERGMLLKFDGGEGDDERATAMLRFFVYPNKTADVGSEWTWEEPKFGYSAICKFVGIENGPLARITCLVRSKTQPKTRAVGLFKVRPDGIVESLDWTLESFMHPWFGETPVSKWTVVGIFDKRVAESQTFLTQAQPGWTIRGINGNQIRRSLK